MCEPASTCSPSWRRTGRRCSASCEPRSRSATAATRTCCGARRSGHGRSAGSGCMPTPRRLRGRREASTIVGRSGQRIRRRRMHAAGRCRLRRSGGRVPARRVRPHHRAVRAEQRARGQAHPAHGAWRARRLPGKRAVGALAGRPGQSPGRSTSRCARSSSKRSGQVLIRRTTQRRGEDAGRPSRPRAAPRTPRALHPVHSPGRGRTSARSTSSHSIGVARSRWRRACRRDSRRQEDGGTRRCSCRAAS